MDPKDLIITVDAKTDPSTGSDPPFFMVVSYMNPHTPINPLKADYNKNKHIKNEVWK